MISGRRLASFGALCAALILVAMIGSAAASSPAVAYCSLPSNGAQQTWAFHAGAPIKHATGSYAHGHGGLSGSSANGEICQVDRVAGAPDRQIILSVTHGTAVPQHAVTENGELGNRLRLPVRVSSSTDARCKVGTHGTVTLFATYNGVHDDSVRFSFAGACHRHNHLYRGSRVVALVPR